MGKKPALEKWESIRDACLDGAMKIVGSGEEHRVQSLLVSAGIAEQNIKYVLCREAVERANP